MMRFERLHRLHRSPPVECRGAAARALLQVLESVAGHKTAEPEILGVTLAAVLTNLHALAQAVEDTEQVAHVVQGSTVDTLRTEHS